MNSPEAIRAAEAISIEIDKRTGTVLASWEEAAIADIIDREMNAWRPIKDAEDGIPYIVLIGGIVQHLTPYVVSGQWFSSEDNSELDCFDPTHFRELPAPLKP